MLGQALQAAESLFEENTMHALDPEETPPEEVCALKYTTSSSVLVAVQAKSPVASVSMSHADPVVGVAMMLPAVTVPSVSEALGAPGMGSY